MILGHDIYMAIMILFGLVMRVNTYTINREGWKLCNIPVVYLVYLEAKHTIKHCCDIYMYVELGAA